MKHSLAILFYLFTFTILAECSYAGDIEFNTDLLDVKDKESINSGAFKKVGYIFPGEYTMQVVINDNAIGERKIIFKEQPESVTSLCVTVELANEFGLKDIYLQRLLMSKHEGNCYNPDVLEGLIVKGDISKDTLTISIPQAYRDYINESWDPPSHWDGGVNGVLLDYGINLQKSRRANGNDSTNASAYGVAGINMGEWRFRGDWQGRYQNNRNQENSESEFEINRLYTYLALPERNARLMLGELDSGNSMFDSFQFIGASIVTDDNMLPPNLRGYAPEVVGIAKTNAKVVISQQGRVIYETQVASGPFRIQDISSSISGTLDVRVEEQDNSVQIFQVNTATIPYLSRPGSIRYKLYSGKVNSNPHDLDGPFFISGDFSWGVSNGWSLLGGALISDGYDAAAIGLGRDLLQFGAISFDITESWAQLAEGTKSGGSYRVNYSKNFEEYESQLTFAGYRFSDRNFMNINEFTAAKFVSHPYQGGSKEMYSVMLSKQFNAVKLGAYIDYTHQSYWSEIGNDRISISISKYFDVMDWRDLTASLTAYYNEHDNQADNGMYFTISVPFGPNKHLSYNASSIGGNATNSVSFFNRVDDRNSYSVTAFSSKTGESASGFYTHTGDKATVIVNANYQAGDSTGVGLSINSGLTATAEGAALHRVGMMGGSRIMVDTDGVSDVPVHTGGPATFTDKYGKAVVADVSSYYRQRTSIDIDQLGDDVEPVGSPVSMSTLTEGAIGYRHFEMLSGNKRMLELVKPDGKSIPFAAEAFNDKGQQLGIVGDDGMVYLSGLHAGLAVEVRWGDAKHCRFYLPSTLPTADAIARLTCH
ncbi:fimbria/pilus outer membrane usher protein [Aeromonas salmonicida]|uniref:fimbria/pilus outer membrane usher protein n=1 Tax=Aeromonas salmonicida TaxID=645 RepID=UPI003F7C405A